MEAVVESKNGGGWSFAANWNVAEGSLVNSITVESSLSPIDDDSPAKSPLILNPPSVDSGPCEIKISFTQKHEIRQVYVRSTARVYEVYWAPDLQSINEYLCTVRCSIAVKDEKSLHANDIEDPVSTHVEESDGKLAQENSKNGKLAQENSKNCSGVSSSEDGWVEVKAPDSHPHDDGSSSLQSKINTNAGRISQDFYEATAEISDADPCISLSLRLLSLQNKECVYVDEIYVFVDPVESDSSDSQVGCLENPAGSSLMALFVPTLLQLSKAGVNRKQDKCVPDIREDQSFSKVGSTATDSTNINNKIEEGISCLPDQLKVDEGTAERAPSLVKISNLVPDTERGPDYVAKDYNFPYNQLEKTMEQLVSRVGRIEYLFLRFEESMLKPISSIEARLQRVEQQMEALTKKFEGPEIISSTRIFAPEFPCNESDSNSCNEPSDCPSHGALECDKQDSVNDTTILHPSLVVVAPEFSNGDETDASEQVNDSQMDSLRENDAPESVKDSPRDEPKHTMSVDDALASALAGFLSSASVRPSKYAETLTVRAPEFPGEEYSSEDKIASPIIYPETPRRTENNKDCISTPCNLSPSVSGVEVETEAAEGIEKQSQLDDGGGKFNSVESGIISSIIIENQVASRMDDYHHTIEKFDKTEANGIPISNEFYIPIRFLGDESDDSSGTTSPQKETVESTDLANATEVKEDILRDFLQFSCSPAVDFHVPILDVEFISRENSSISSSLEVLLTNIAEPNSSTLEAPCIKEIHENTPISSSSLRCSSLPADDAESQSHPTDNHLLLEFDNCKAPAGKEDESQQDPHTRSMDEPFESLI